MVTIVIATALALFNVAPASPLPHAIAVPQIQNANHIFNALHSSMRQFGSSLNHNGMSIFIATVPEDTEFYHGTSSPYRVNGTEWLAFEPEHALMFAGGRLGGPGGPGGHGPPDGDRGRSGGNEGPPDGERGPPNGEGPPEDGVPPGEMRLPRPALMHDGHRGGPKWPMLLPWDHDGKREHGSPPPPPPPEWENYRNDLRRHERPRGPRSDYDKLDREDGRPTHNEDPESMIDDKASRRHPPKHDEQRPGRHHGPPGPPPGENRDDHRSQTPRHGPLPRPGVHPDDNDPRPPHGPPFPPPGDDLKGDRPPPSHGPPSTPTDDKICKSTHIKPDDDREFERDGWTLWPFKKPSKPDSKCLRSHKTFPSNSDHDESHQERHCEPSVPDDGIMPPHRKPENSHIKYKMPDAEERETITDVVVGQKPIMSGKADEAHGYLHTYRTKHALRLVYVDGQSAAKSQKGTLDTQDKVILHYDPPETYERDGERRPHGPMGEAERAIGMCSIASEEWGGHIDGILRMEGGFEVILCDFAKDLDVVSIAQSKEESSDGRHGPGGDSGDRYSYYQAVAARYDGIGGDRVQVDYDNFVTLFAHPNAIYFDDDGRPRVNNVTAAIDPIREAISEMARGSDDSTKSLDWQAVADMVVARYSDRIEYLASGNLQSLESFKAEVDRALRPFIDSGNRDTKSEIDRCAGQFLPRTQAASRPLAAAAISNVTSVLCRTLSAASEVDTLPHGLSMIRGLKSWLAWTTWKNCHGCEAHELCFLPIWPSGSAEDFEQPQCRSDVSAAPGGYWGGFGGPPRRGHDREMI